MPSFDLPHILTWSLPLSLSFPILNFSRHLFAGRVGGKIPLLSQASPQKPTTLYASTIDHAFTMCTVPSHLPLFSFFFLVKTPAFAFDYPSGELPNVKLMQMQYAVLYCAILLRDWPYVWKVVWSCTVHRAYYSTVLYCLYCTCCASTVHAYIIEFTSLCYLQSGFKLIVQLQKYFSRSMNPYFFLTLLWHRFSRVLLFLYNV